MASAFDQRIVRVGLEIKNQFYMFEGLHIVARGTKFRGALLNQCSLRISNLTREQRTFILTEATPYAKITEGSDGNQPLLKPINMTLDVGRESTGVFRLYEGQVFQGGVTQPPDIAITLNSLTSNFLQANTVAVSQDSTVDIRTIAEQVAKDNGLTLEFNASPKNIPNYSYTGSAAGQIRKLNEMGGVIAYIDNGALVVTDADQPRVGEVRLINAQTGMIGVPQATASGVVVQVMLDNTIVVGQQVRIFSEINPGCNGDFIVQTMQFEVANREQPFWFTLDCINMAFYTGGTL